MYIYAVYNNLAVITCAVDPASGLTLEYAKEKGGTKFTFTPELRGGRFDPPASEIGPSEQEFWSAMVAQMDAIAERRAM